MSFCSASGVLWKHDVVQGSSISLLSRAGRQTNFCSEDCADDFPVVMVFSLLVDLGRMSAPFEVGSHACLLLPITERSSVTSCTFCRSHCISHGSLDLFHYGICLKNNILKCACRPS